MSVLDIRHITTPEHRQALLMMAGEELRALRIARAWRLWRCAKLLRVEEPDAE